MQAPIHGDLVLPPSYVRREAHLLDKAVNEYDERLHFGLHPQTEQWVITIRTEDGEVPILGFTRFGEPLPSRDRVMERLFNSDARKHGERILERINRQNREAEKAMKYKADQGIGEAAEHLEYWLRRASVQDGHTGSMGKTFIPRSVKGD